MIMTFSVTQLNMTAVRVMWQAINNPALQHYTVYYTSSSQNKRQIESGSKNFSADSTQGDIGGLDPNLQYMFSMSVTFVLDGVEYESEQTQPLTTGKRLNIPVCYI